MSKYRIERRNEADQPTGYWSARRSSWLAVSALATIYSQDDRDLFMRDATNFPVGGCWVIVNDPEHLGDLFVQPTRNNFTTIKLRPVVIRLSATEGEYADLNAQVDEFEAAVRQFVRKQQILIGDEWAVDVIGEEE